MSIAISEEHRALAQTVAGFLTDHQSRAQARSLLGAQAEALPAFWAELAGLGLLGLHVPEELGGSGFGLAETLVVAEQMGRHLAPGPFCPTVIASAVLSVAGPDDLRKRLLPGLADGTVIGAAALGGEVRSADGVATGKAGVVISGHLAAQGGRADNRTVGQPRQQPLAQVIGPGRGQYGARDHGRAERSGGQVPAHLLGHDQRFRQSEARAAEFFGYVQPE